METYIFQDSELFYQLGKLFIVVNISQLQKEERGSVYSTERIQSFYTTASDLWNGAAGIFNIIFYLCLIERKAWM